MWLEENVRLSEVTDLKWPHGTEWQCGTSTLAISWPNHVQILSFASMASRQGAVKHGFVSKIAGGCSSYDVTAPWPDLIWSFFFTKSCARFAPSGIPKPDGATRRRFFAICEKPQGWGCTVAPPLSGRGLAVYHRTKCTLHIDGWVVLFHFAPAEHHLTMPFFQCACFFLGRPLAGRGQIFRQILYWKTKK